MVTSPPAVPITRPLIPAGAAVLVQDCLDSGWLTQGPKVAAFEAAFAELVGVKHAKATSNCTTALFAMLAVLGVGPGKEVITTPYSFIATANVIVHLGARPVFVDIDPKTFNLDASLIEPAITDRTVGILPVHQVGLAADLDAIRSIAESNNLWVVEDAACAIGSRYKGRPIGGGSTAACFSFHPRKVLTTGEGGMIVTDDGQLAQSCATLISHGASVLEEKRHGSAKHLNPSYVAFGYNFRMSDLQAAVGLAQLPHLADHLAARKRLAQRYTRAFQGDERINPPFIPNYAEPSYQSYMITLPSLNGTQRDELIQRLRDQGVASNPGITGIPFEPVYQKTFGPVSLPNTERAMATSLILPLYPQMTEEDQDRVIDALIRTLDQLSGVFDDR